MSWVNAPICERCWIRREGSWAIDEAEGFEYLASLRMPVRLTEPELEACFFCHHPTIFGAYVRTESTLPL